MDRPTIKLSTTGTQLAYPADDCTLLEVLKRHQVPVDYQCRAGYCGACRTRLLTGKVAYHHSPLASLQEGEILPCCCAPVGDIELEL